MKVSVQGAAGIVLRASGLGSRLSLYRHSSCHFWEHTMDPTVGRLHKPRAGTMLAMLEIRLDFGRSYWGQFTKRLMGGCS